MLSQRVRKACLSGSFLFIITVENVTARKISLIPSGIALYMLNRLSIRDRDPAGKAFKRGPERKVFDERL
jgi:hypothetical protein